MIKKLAKCVLTIFILLGIVSSAYAASGTVKGLLIDDQGDWVGTSGNPLYVSFSGDQIIDGSLSIQNDLTVTRDLYVDGTAQGVTAGSWGLVDETVSATNPTVLPNKADADSGLGWAAADQFTLVAGGVEGARVIESGGSAFFSVNDGNKDAVGLSFGNDLDTGFYGDGTQIKYSEAGTNRWGLNGARIEYIGASNGPRVDGATAWRFVPNRDDQDTAYGGTSGSSLDLYVNNVIIAQVDGNQVELRKGQQVNTTTVNAATYDLLATDYSLHVAYTASGAVTSLTLPTAQAVDGRVIKITDTGGNASANNITVDTQGAETINGAATLVFNSDYESHVLESDGTNWFVTA